MEILLNKTIVFTIEIIVIIALTAMLLIIPSIYLKNSTEKLNIIVDRLLEETFNEDYDSAAETIKELKDIWEQEKKLRSMILEEKYIMDVDNSIIQCEAAIKTKDKPMAYEYANIIKHNLEESLFSASFNLENIF